VLFSVNEAVDSISQRGIFVEVFKDSISISGTALILKTTRHTANCRAFMSGD